MAEVDLTALCFAGFTLDPAARTLVDAAGRDVPLRRSEYELLRAFLAAPGRALSRDHLLDAVAGRRAEPFDRSVDMLVARLRQKIEPDPKEPRLIVTVPGVGYRFAARPRPASAEGDATPVAEPTPPPAPPASPERRQLTVLRCGLCGPALVSARRDPEDLQRLLVAFHAQCAAIIQGAGGTVAQRLGETVLGYFGYPETHEDVAERAIRAALRLVEAAGETEAGRAGASQVRVGIATGLVLVGHLLGAGSGDPAVLGEAPSLAAGLLACAEPGTVLIGPTTRRLVGDLFQCREHAPVPLEGLAEPLPAWQVLGEGVESRFEALRGHTVAELVGREEELSLLLRRWEQAKAGTGRAVLVIGEPGIGKSRLVWAVQERLAGEAARRLRYLCSPHHQGSALYPVIAEIERAAGFVRDDTAETKLAKLGALLAKSGAGDEAVALIAALLSIPTGEPYRLPEAIPQRLRERTLAALLELFAGLVARGPALVLFKDVHWADPTTLEVLARTVERVASMRALLLITARPEFKPPWPDQAHAGTLVLNRLGDDEAAALAQHVAGQVFLPGAALRHIVRHAEGVPLFVEELTKAVLEGGLPADGEGSAPLPVPTSLHDLLLARLDRLGPAREVAQIGAVIGREFSYDLLRAVAALPDGRLQEVLHDLVQSELVYCRGVPPEAAYTFKHALVQDAAYQAMLKSRRTHLHKCIAEALELSFPELVQTEPETLAQHFTAAACAQRAIHYWLAAGQRARQRSAHQEAVRHFSAGIALLSNVPEQIARMRLEVDLQAALGFALIVAKGYAAPEVEAAFSRAYELCQTVGDTSLAIPVLRGLTTFHWVSGNLPTAKRFGLQLAEIAERISDAELSSVLHGMLGGIFYYMGKISQSETWFGKLRAAYDHQERRNIIVRFGEDTPSTTWCFHGFNLAWLGHFDMASAAVRDAVASTRRAEHPYSVANALCRAAVCHVILRDPVRAASFAEQCVAIARELGFPIPLAMATVVLGWASVLDGKVREGISQIHDGIAQWRSTGAGITLPFYSALLSEAMLAGGDIGAAIAAADEGWQWGARNSEHAWDCFLHCGRGDALVTSGELADAEADYQQALAWSRERSAKWGELYAGIRLARLWRSDGRTGQARKLLAPIYEWFTEGFNTAVLKDAKALLDEPASSRI